MPNVWVEKPCRTEATEAATGVMIRIPAQIEEEEGLDMAEVMAAVGVMVAVAEGVGVGAGV